MFNEINEGGLNNILSARLGMRGGSAAPAVAPEVFPVMNLENDRPEWSWLKGELLRSTRVSIAAVAANFNSVQLYLPTTRKSIAVVTQIVSHTATLVEVGRSFIGGGLAGWVAVNNGARDTRDGSVGASVLVERTTTPGFAASFVNLGALLNSTQQYTAPIVLAPKGQALIIGTEQVNQSLSLTIHWYERGANPGELV